MKKFSLLVIILLSFTLQNCGVYSFTGGSVGEAKTINIPFFANNANFVEPTLSSEFQRALQDRFLQQTNLSLTNDNADLSFEGEITQYRIVPIAATANQTAAQSRLTIAIKVRFYNKLVKEDDFEKSFTHFYDYNADQQLTGGTLDDAFTTIFKRITQDVFNEAVAKW